MLCKWYQIVSFALIVLIGTKGGVFGATCVNGKEGGCELNCEQITADQVRCSCGLLGELEANNKTCYIKPRLIFGYSTSLVFADEEKNGQIQTIQWRNIIDANKVIFIMVQDYAHHRIFLNFFQTPLLNTVGYIDVKKRTLFKIADYIGKPVFGIAYDNINADLYLSFNKEIRVIRNYDSQITRASTTFQNINAGGELQIDSLSRLLFFIDSENIARVNLTSGNRVDLFNQTLSGIVSFTLDEVGEKIFWISDGATGDIIEMANYDGTCRKILQQVNSNKPYSITFWDGHLYWSDNNKQIYRTLVENGRTDSTGITLNLNVFAVNFYGQPNNTGTWSSWSTSTTQPNVLHRRCMKPEIPYYKDKTCMLETTGNKFKCQGDAIKRNPIPQSDDGESKSVSTTTIVGITIGAIVFLILLLAIVRILYKKHTRSKMVTNRPAPPIPFDVYIPPSTPNNTASYLCPSEVYHDYETIPELQQQLKEKALQGDFMQNQDPSNRYLDPAKLRVDLPKTEEKEPASDMNDYDNPTLTAGATGVRPPVDPPSDYITAENLRQPQASTDDFHKMIESNRLSI